MSEESLRDYVVKLLFKTDEHGAEEAHGAVEKLTEAIEELGKKAFVFNQLIDAVRELAEPFMKFGEMIDEVAREAAGMTYLAERTGIAAEELEKLGYVAKQSGVSADEVTGSLRLLQRQMGMAGEEGKQAREAFASLGVNIREPNGELKNAVDLLPELSDKFQKMGSDAERTAKAMQIFGRGGQAMIPILKKSREEIEELNEELEQLGGASTEEFMAASREYVEGANKMAMITKGLKEAVAGPFVNAINEARKSVVEWYKANGELIRQRVGEWAQQVIDSFKAWWETGSKVAAVMLLVAAALNIPLIAAIGLRAILLLLIDDFMHWMAGNDSLIGRAVEHWDEWLDELRQTSPVLAWLAEAFGKAMKFVYDWMQDVKKAWYDIEKNFEELGFIDSIKLAFKGLGQSIADFLLAPITDTWSKIKDLIFDMMIKAKGVASSLGFDSIAGTIGSTAASFMRGNIGSDIVQGHRMMASGIAGAVGLSGGNSASSNVSVVVNAAPGMDETMLAEKVAQHVKDANDSMIRNAFDDLVPASY